ncbi:MAG: DNA repair protein RecO [Alphaproteobacteria bacterium]
MESWEDQGIVLSVRAHGENGGVVSLLTQDHGRHAGFVRGIHSSKMRGITEVGTLVDARWQARVSDNLGSYMLEHYKSYAPNIMSEPLKLAALQSACALCDHALPEREGHSGLYHGLLALFETLESDIWGAAYIMWEIAFLRELGFSLDLSKCAGGGDDQALAYVSPKTGRAVSYEAGAPYKEKLLDLPAFLKPNGGPAELDDIKTGLKLTGYFLEHWAFTHHSQGIPPERARFYERLAKQAEKHINSCR